MRDKLKASDQRMKKMVDDQSKGSGKASTLQNMMSNMASKLAK